MQKIKIFANENLTSLNKSTVFNYRNLKNNGIIHSCVFRNDMIGAKYKRKNRPVNTFHMDKLQGFFHVFDFGDADDKEDCFRNELCASSE